MPFQVASHAWSMNSFYNGIRVEEGGARERCRVLQIPDWLNTPFILNIPQLSCRYHWILRQVHIFQWPYTWLHVSSRTTFRCLGELLQASPWQSYLHDVHLCNIPHQYLDSRHFTKCSYLELHETQHHLLMYIHSLENDGNRWLMDKHHNL